MKVRFYFIKLLLYEIITQFVVHLYPYIYLLQLLRCMSYYKSKKNKLVIPLHRRMIII